MSTVSLILTLINPNYLPLLFFNPSLRNFAVFPLEIAFSYPNSLLAVNLDLLQNHASMDHQCPFTLKPIYSYPNSLLAVNLDSLQNHGPGASKKKLAAQTKAHS